MGWPLLFLTWWETEGHWRFGSSQVSFTVILVLDFRGVTFYILDTVKTPFYYYFGCDMEKIWTFAQRVIWGQCHVFCTFIFYSLKLCFDNKGVNPHSLCDKKVKFVFYVFYIKRLGNFCSFIKLLMVFISQAGYNLTRFSCQQLF